MERWLIFHLFGDRALFIKQTDKSLQTERALNTKLCTSSINTPWPFQMKGWQSSTKEGGEQFFALLMRYRGFWLCRKQDTIETSENTRVDSWLHIFLSFPFTTSFHLLISPSVPQTKDTFCLLCAWTPPPLIFSCLSMPSSQYKQ